MIYNKVTGCKIKISKLITVLNTSNQQVEFEIYKHIIISISSQTNETFSDKPNKISKDPYKENHETLIKELKGVNN